MQSFGGIIRHTLMYSSKFLAISLESALYWPIISGWFIEPAQFDESICYLFG